MARKNPHAVALGKRGGKANTPAQQAARAANRNTKGRPPLYRITTAGEFQKRHGDSWLAIDEPDAAAKRWLRIHRK